MSRTNLAVVRCPVCLVYNFVPKTVSEYVCRFCGNCNRKG